jgi:hypothetical protein
VESSGVGGDWRERFAAEKVVLGVSKVSSCNLCLSGIVGHRENQSVRTATSMTFCVHRVLGSSRHTC